MLKVPCPVSVIFTPLDPVGLRNQFLPARTTTPQSIPSPLRSHEGFATVTASSQLTLQADLKQYPLNADTAGMKSRLLVVAAGLCLLIPAWTGIFSSGFPTLYAPLPALTILPAFELLRWHREFFAVLIPSLLFFLWSPELLLNQRPNVPKRTIVLLGLLTILAALHFAFGWKYGMQYEGERYTFWIAIINMMWLFFLWWAVIHWSRQPSFKGHLLSHWFLFAWLAWYAFPYLGELP